MIEIVFVGNIASCGMDAFSRHLKTPHRLLTYPCDLSEAGAMVGSLSGGFALLPLLFKLGPSDLLPLATAASYLVTIAIVAVAGAHLQDRLRRREHRARIEMARQIGLVNLGGRVGGIQIGIVNFAKRLRGLRRLVH